MHFGGNVCILGIFRVEDNANICILGDISSLWGIYRVYGTISSCHLIEYHIFHCKIMTVSHVTHLFYYGISFLEKQQMPWLGREISQSHGNPEIYRI